MNNMFNGTQMYDDTLYDVRDAAYSGASRVTVRIDRVDKRFDARDRIREELLAGEAFEKDATEGPWTAHPEYEAWLRTEHCDAGDFRGTIAEVVEGYGPGDSDAFFIADARTRLPRYRRALEAVLAQLCEEGSGIYGPATVEDSLVQSARNALRAQILAEIEAVFH